MFLITSPGDVVAAARAEAEAALADDAGSAAAMLIAIAIASMVGLIVAYAISFAASAPRASRRHLHGERAEPSLERRLRDLENSQAQLVQVIAAHEAAAMRRQQLQAEALQLKDAADVTPSDNNFDAAAVLLPALHAEIADLKLAGSVADVFVQGLYAEVTQLRDAVSSKAATFRELKAEVAQLKDAQSVPEALTRDLRADITQLDFVLTATAALMPEIQAEIAELKAAKAEIADLKASEKRADAMLRELHEEITRLRVSSESTAAVAQDSHAQVAELNCAHFAAAALIPKLQSEFAEWTQAVQTELSLLKEAGKASDALAHAVRELQAGVAGLKTRQAAAEAITQELGMRIRGVLVPPLLAQMQSTDPEKSTEAGRVLALVGGSVARKTLTEALGDSNSLVRGEAALALGAVGGQDVVAPLTAVLRNDLDADVRWRAAEALSRVVSPASLGALEAAMRLDSSAAVRGAAAGAVLLLATPGALATEAKQLVIDALHTGRDGEFVRAGTALILSRVSAHGDERRSLDAAVLSVLEQAMRSDEDARVRAAAAGAVHAHCKPAPVAVEAQDIAVNALRSGSSWNIRLCAAEALVANDGAEARAALAAAASNDESEHVRLAARGALASAVMRP